MESTKKLNVIRNEPHIEGNFSTHLSFKLFQKSEKITKFKEFIKNILIKNESKIFEEVMETKCSYHISLCDNIYLK